MHPQGPGDFAERTADSVLKIKGQIGELRAILTEIPNAGVESPIDVDDRAAIRPDQPPALVSDEETAGTPPVQAELRQDLFNRLLEILHLPRSIRAFRVDDKSTLLVLEDELPGIVSLPAGLMIVDTHFGPGRIGDFGSPQLVYTRVWRCFTRLGNPQLFPYQRAPNAIHRGEGDSGEGTAPYQLIIVDGEGSSIVGRGGGSARRALLNLRNKDNDVRTRSFESTVSGSVWR